MLSREKGNIVVRSRRERQWEEQVHAGVRKTAQQVLMVWTCEHQQQQRMQHNCDKQLKEAVKVLQNIWCMIVAIYIYIFFSDL